MRLQDWLIGEIDSIDERLSGQVHDVVPAESQKLRVQDGNSIAWSTFHVSKHAALALRVLGHLPLEPDPRLADFPDASRGAGAGLQEVEQAWATELDVQDIRQFATSVIDDIREYLTSTPELPGEVPVRARLEAAGVDAVAFGWLYDMWSSQPASFLVRWPLLGHITNHVGEMIATRNLLGFSPYR
jgi:hypothetical protein